MRVRKLFFVVLLVAISASYSSGQFINTTISRAVISCKDERPKLDVEFEKSLFSLLEDARKTHSIAPGTVSSQSSLKNLIGLKNNIETLENTEVVSALSIIRINSGSVVDVAGTVKPVMFRYTVSGRSEITISEATSATLGDNLPDVLEFEVNKFEYSNDTLGLVMQGVTKNPSMAIVSVDPSCKPVVTSLPKQTERKDTLVPGRLLSEKLDGDVTKEDANFMLDFSLDGTKRSATVRKNAFGTLGLTVVPKHFTKLGFHGIYEFQPFFYELSYKATADKTTFITNMGTRLNHLFVFGDDGRGYSNTEDKRQLIPGISTTITGKLEVERFFKSTNLVGEFQSGLPFNVWQSRAWKARFEPSVGIGLGRNLNQPDDAARAVSFVSGNTASRWIARPFFYGEFVFEGWRDRFIKPNISVSYRRSFPLFSEAFLDVKGKTVAGYSRTVRDYVTAKLTFDAGKLLTPFFSYERGRQSPGYVLVDSKFKLGIGIKFKGKDR